MYDTTKRIVKEVFVIKTKSVQNILNDCYIIPKDKITKEQKEILENINIENYFTESEIERGYVFIRNVPNKKVPKDIQNKILEDRKEGMSIRKLSQKYNFSVGTINLITNNKY